MKVDKLDDMKGGWFVGNFAPSCARSEDAEVAFKRYRRGDAEPLHVHKVSTEITLIIAGAAKMNGRVFTAGDIITLLPGEPTNFEALDDVATVVVKLPSAIGDKYILELDDKTQ